MASSYRSRRSAFSLIEAMVALSITAMAGAVLLLATEGVLKTTNDAVAQTIAQGMAAQLLDEVLGARYCAADDPYETTFARTAYENAGAGRERFDDTGDYHGFSTSPPEDMWGHTLGKGDEGTSRRHPLLQAPGNDFADWRQKIEVYYVDPADPTVRRPNSSPSDYRAVEVTIERTEPNGAIRPLATMRRVFCYVPIP
jgi:type II secretory pathway pseudopilin PulG